MYGICLTVRVDHGLSSREQVQNSPDETDEVGQR